MEESHVGGVEPRRQRTPRASTIYDVARLAGVSHQTVSRLIHGEDRIKPQNRERILRAIQELGYQPNLAARSLATHRPHRIALLTQEIAQVGPARMLQGANEAARQAGYLLDITTLDMTDRRTILDTIAIVSGSNTAGILALASTDHVLEALDRAAFRLPAVIGAEEDERDVAHPEQVNQRGMNQIVDHLVQLGHRRFFHIGGPHSWVVARNRAQAFDRAVTRHGLAPAGFAHGDWSAASGHAAVQAMPADLNVTAVVAANDQMAVGAIYGLKEMGKRVPQHVSVTGFDDIPEARYLHPPLTTVRIDLGAQGAVAFERLLARMEGTDAPVRESTADFMRRASTAEAATL